MRAIRFFAILILSGSCILASEPIISPSSARRSDLPVVHSMPAVLPGEVVCVDSGDCVLGGCVMKVNLLTGERTILSRGGLLTMPLGVVLTREGRIIVTDCGRLIEVDVSSGEQALLTSIGCAAGLALDRDGNILIAGLHAILRYDVTTGQIAVVAGEEGSTCMLSVVELPNGDLAALDASYPATLVRINKSTGVQTLIARGGMLHSPQSLVADNNYLYVTDVATPDGNFGIGRIIRIHAQTGVQEEIACGGYLVGPVGITLDADGNLIIGDPYTVNPDSPDLYDGGILRVDPRTGEQELICCGGGNLVNPRGVAVLPFASANRARKRHRPGPKLLTRGQRPAGGAGEPASASSFVPITNSETGSWKRQPPNFNSEPSRRK